LFTKRVNVGVLNEEDELLGSFFSLVPFALL